MAMKVHFIPLTARNIPPVQDAYKAAVADLIKQQDAMLTELDTLLNDGWRVVAHQPVEDGRYSGTMFILRDDADAWCLTEDGRAVLLEEVTG